MTGGLVSPLPAADLNSRLLFLHHVIDDTQNTIRFLDTKAAFCVTLLSGMTALTLGRAYSGTYAHLLCFRIFMLIAAASLLTCLRVIFPTIKPSGSSGAPASPKFYIGHNKAHRWVLHTFSNQSSHVLSETHDSYLGELRAATDDDLLSSLCDEALLVALIRQVKSDRLHAAMICLVVTVLAFAAVVLT
jgi:hypothetical protein